MTASRTATILLVVAGLFAGAVQADEAASATSPPMPTAEAAFTPDGAVAADAGTAAAAPAVTVAPKKPRLVFEIRGGGDTAPAYFGSSEQLFWHDWHVKIDYLRLFGHEFGQAEPGKPRYGFGLQSSFRVVNERDGIQYPELAGLNYILPSIEVGVGAAYNQRKYRVYGDVRYGLFGHQDWVGEIGGDLRFYPRDKLELWAGPRLFFGTSSYSDRYYGITPAESAASGLAAFNPSPGLLRVGVELGANLDIHEKWDFEMAMTYDRLVRGAADSPITQMGSEEQLGARIGFIRRFTLR